MEYELIKEFIVDSWVKAGFTCDDIKEIVKDKDCMEKMASDVISDVGSALFKNIPILSFGVPLIGGALAYSIFHPSELLEAARKKRIKELDKFISIVDVQKGRHRNVL